MDDDMSIGLRWRIPFSIIFGVGLLIFILAWLAFYAGDYSGYQNIAILLGSILLIFVLLGGIWVRWSLKMIPKEGWEIMRIAGFRWRIAISILLPFIGMIFLIFWFYSYAELYNIYQNIAIFIIIWLIFGGILGGLWAQYSMKHKQDFDAMKDIGEESEKHFKEKE
ncbi:MAG: hypothetical protein KKG04_08895, partial [Candidatus Thermoplasmatota archaeon]|nr:hypothetical protein [Candidatus Thermoplasmatota archaeon]